MAEEKLGVQLAGSHTGLPSPRWPALCAVGPLSLDGVIPVRRPGTLGGRGQRCFRDLSCLGTFPARQLWAALRVTTQAARGPRRGMPLPSPALPEGGSAQQSWHTVGPQQMGVADVFMSLKNLAKRSAK